MAIHQHSYRFSHHYMSSIFWDTPTPENNLLQFHDLLNMEWNTSMNSVIFSFLEMTCVTFFFPDKLCHNRKIPVKFSKELYATSRPWNYNYALHN